MDRFERRTYFFLFVFIFQLATAMMVLGCGSVRSPALPDAGRQDAQEAAGEVGDDEGYLPPPGGLPPGYNERGCQWDGCQGPPDKLAPAVDPMLDLTNPASPLFQLLIIQPMLWDSD